MGAAAARPRWRLLPVQPADPDPAHPPGPGEAFFRVLLEDYTDVIVVLGEDGAIRYATPSAAALFGRGPIIGARLPDLVGDDARPEVTHAVDRMLGRTGPDAGPGGETWQITGKDGRDVHVQVRSSDLRAVPAVSGLVLTLRDVTSQREHESELRRLASYDALTGLPNRTAFADRAAHAVALAYRTGTTAAVMLADLDDFKAVNDTLGHPAGDELLTAAAARLAGAVRESDTAARHGGDEFVMLLENLPGPAAAGAFADRTVQAFSAPFILAAGQVTIGVTIGVATTADSTDVEGLLAHADLALYAAKAAGKQAWRAYDAAMTGSMPAPGRTRTHAAEISNLEFPDPRPGTTGRRAPGKPAGPRNRTAAGEDRQRPQITP
jgi:diguanylate cyclase (GGDEF)-like protein/PAS domain S-box-containing protein